MKKQLFILPSLLLAGTGLIRSEEKQPNIIFILADDLGYGDVSALNAQSKINTPQIDKMIGNGVTFNDAHTSSSVSTPTRYGILTGRYNWRSTLKNGVLNGYSNALIPDNRTTIASLLKRKNYTTACIGKWHLGWNWDNIKQGEDQIDFTKPIQHGPTSVGFDYFYGFCGSLDMPPYVYVENEKPTALPNRTTENKAPGFWRKGPTASDFVHEEVLPHITDRAIDFIQKESRKKGKPFFLYLPLPAPHTPILPTGEFLGKSKLNMYADFVMMVDHHVGRILQALEKAGIDKNTLVVFTSDNGCSPQANYDELLAKGHNPSYIYRGHKADLFEGGHRVPCVVQWKGNIKPGESAQTICLTDFFTTFADVTGIAVKNTEGEDSYSLLPALKDPGLTTPIREATVHHSITGEFAIRKGDWKLLVSPSSGGWSFPKPSDKKALAGLLPMQLYNIKNDPGEKNNLYASQQAIADQLLTLLRSYITKGRSVPGENQFNETTGRWKQLETIFQP